MSQLKGFKIENGLVYGKYDSAWTVGSFQNNNGKDDKVDIDRVFVLDGMSVEALVEGWAKNAKVQANVPLKRLTRTEIENLNKTELVWTDLGKKVVSPEMKRTETVINFKNLPEGQRLKAIAELKEAGII